jgi:hypothetical protein
MSIEDDLHQARAALSEASLGGLVALTGPPDRAPILPPVGVLVAIRRLARAVERSAADLGAAIELSWTEVVTGRAALLGLGRQGQRSANGSCRLLPCGDGWVALNLARTEDVASLDALMGLVRGASSTGSGRPTDSWRPTGPGWPAESGLPAAPDWPAELGLPTEPGWPADRRRTTDLGVGTQQTRPMGPAVLTGGSERADQMGGSAAGGAATTPWSEEIWEVLAPVVARSSADVVLAAARLLGIPAARPGCQGGRGQSSTPNQGQRVASRADAPRDGTRCAGRFDGGWWPSSGTRARGVPWPSSGIRTHGVTWWRRWPPSQPRPIDRLLVADLSALWAGPLVGAVLAAAGATVVKVELEGRTDGARRQPDVYRWLHPVGQTEVVVDVSTTWGRRALRELVADADVVIEASRPRALAQLGVGPDQVGDRPGKVWAAITGHGRAHPAAGWVAFGDDAAVAGGLVIEEPPTGAPVFIGDAIADPVTGLSMADAVLRALASGGGWLLDGALSAAAAAIAAAAWRVRHVAAGVLLPEPSAPVVDRLGDGWAVRWGGWSWPVLPPSRPRGPAVRARAREG